MTSERHAQATYQNVLTKLGNVSPFDNVAASEATHVTAVVGLANTHGIDVSTATSAGDPSPATLRQACQAGVDIEHAVVAMYDDMIPKVSAYPDVVRVFTNLRDNSQSNHLAAFERCN